MTHLATIQFFLPAPSVTPTTPAAIAFDDIFANITAPTPHACPPCSSPRPMQNHPESILDVAAAFAPQKPMLPMSVPAAPVTPTTPAAVAFDDIFVSITAPTPQACPPCSPPRPMQNHPDSILDVAAAFAPQKPMLPMSEPEVTLEPKTQLQSQAQPDEVKAETGPIQNEKSEGVQVAIPIVAQPSSSGKNQIDLGSETRKAGFEQQVQLVPQPAAPVLAQMSPTSQQVRVAGVNLKSTVMRELKPAMLGVSSLPTQFDMPKAAKPKLMMALVPEAGQANVTDTATATDSRLLQLPAMPQVAPTVAQAATPVLELQVTVQTLDMMQDALWLDNLARDITASAATDGKLQFRLLPEFLGKLDIALTHKDDRVDIAMQASTEAAARIITGDQPRLIEELRQSGVKVGNFEMFSGQQNGASKQHNQQPASPPPAVATESKPQRQRNRDSRFA